MEPAPGYAAPPPPPDEGPPVCCDFTTCCYSGLCALLCFSGVAITFIFSAMPSHAVPYTHQMHAHQTWLLGPVLILLSAVVAVKTLLHVRKQRMRAGAVLRRRRYQQQCESLYLQESGLGLDVAPLPRAHDLPPSYEEVLKLMREEHQDPPSPPPEASAEAPDRQHCNSQVRGGSGQELETEPRPV